MTARALRRPLRDLRTAWELRGEQGTVGMLSLSSFQPLLYEIAIPRSKSRKTFTSAKQVSYEIRWLQEAQGPGDVVAGRLDACNSAGSTCGTGRT